MNTKKTPTDIIHKVTSLLSCLSGFVKNWPKTAFIIKFVIFSIMLFILWTQIGRYYTLGISHVSYLVLEGMGYDVALHHNGMIYFMYRGGLINLENTELINFNLASFLALILATPRIRVHRILESLAWGLPILFLLHVINLIFHFPYYDGHSWARAVVSFSGITNMALPFILWIALTHDFVLEAFTRKERAYQCPLCGETKIGILEHFETVHQNMDKKEQQKISIFIDNHPQLKNKKHL